MQLLASDRHTCRQNDMLAYWVVGLEPCAQQAPTLCPQSPSVLPFCRNLHKIFHSLELTT